MEKRDMELEYYIAVFHSRNHAVHLYQHLKNKRLNQFELISTPCRIKAGCSFSIKFNSLEDYEILKKEANSLNKSIQEIYVVQKNYSKKVYKPY